MENEKIYKENETVKEEETKEKLTLKKGLLLFGAGFFKPIETLFDEEVLDNSYTADGRMTTEYKIRYAGTLCSAGGFGALLGMANNAHKINKGYKNGRFALINRYGEYTCSDKFRFRDWNGEVPLTRIRPKK